MQRRTDRAARVLRELQALLGHDCKDEAIARLRARTRRSWGLAEPLVGLVDPRPTLHMLLVEATRAQDRGAVHLLGGLGADPLARLPVGGCALHVAARSFPAAALWLLLRLRLDPRHVRPALAEATLAGHDEGTAQLELWLWRVAHLRPSHEPHRRWPRLVERLLGRLWRPTAQRRLDDALVQAVIEGTEEEVTALLDRGASPDVVFRLSVFRPARLGPAPPPGARRAVQPGHPAHAGERLRARRSGPGGPWSVYRPPPSLPPPWVSVIRPRSCGTGGGRGKNSPGAPASALLHSSWPRTQRPRSVVFLLLLFLVPVPVPVPVPALLFSSLAPALAPALALLPLFPSHPSS